MRPRTVPWLLAVVGVIALAVFAVLTVVVTTSPTLAPDSRAFQTVDDLRAPWLDHAARTVTALGLLAIVGPVLLLAAALLIGVDTAPAQPPSWPERRSPGSAYGSSKLLSTAPARATWVDLRRYFVPSWRPHGWYKGWDIQPQLDWARVPGAAYTRDTLSGMARFFDRFVPRRDPSLVAFMHNYQQLFGFGVTLLCVFTLLTIAGLFVGPRRNLIGVLLFGVGGLAQLIGPTVGRLYMGRYTVPLAGLFTAGGAISAWSLLHALRHRTVRRLSSQRSWRSSAQAVSVDPATPRNA